MTDPGKKAICSACNEPMVEAVQRMVHEGGRTMPAYYGFVHCPRCKRSAEFYELPRGYNLKKFGMRLPGIGVIRKK